MYLRLEVDASRILAQYPMNDTLDTFKVHLISLTGLSPFVALFSKRLQVTRLGLKECPKTTFLLHYCNRFSLPCAVFSRPY